MCVEAGAELPRASPGWQSGAAGRPHSAARSALPPLGLRGTATLARRRGPALHHRCPAQPCPSRRSGRASPQPGTASPRPAALRMRGHPLSLPLPSIFPPLRRISRDTPEVTSLPWPGNCYQGNRRTRPRLSRCLRALPPELVSAGPFPPPPVAVGGLNRPSKAVGG